MSENEGAGLHTGEAVGTSVEDSILKREYSRPERLLLLIALVIGILFDRLVIDGNFVSFRSFGIVTGIFWLCYLVLFYVFNWATLKKNRLIWIIGTFAALLCMWSFFFSHLEYMQLTCFVIPCVLMAHAQIAAQNVKMKQVCKVIVSWFSGFFIRPFSALGHFFGAINSCVGNNKRTFTKNLIIAVLLSIVLLAVILPLLMGADSVFRYYVNQISVNINLGRIVGHAIAIFIVSALFYSHFWNARYRGPIIFQKLDEGLFSGLKSPRLVTYFIVMTALIVYVLFCTVQFTYLFARAGLPADMTYSEYAREGFAQIVAVCILNLLLFGLFLSIGRQDPALRILLVLLLAATAVILVSGFVRLGLYIDAYGITWLRLLSFWFMVFLAAAIIICAVRLFVEKMPAVVVCAIALLIWYTALGYANPEKLISNYNTHYGYENPTYISTNIRI